MQQISLNSHSTILKIVLTLPANIEFAEAVTQFHQTSSSTNEEPSMPLLTLLELIAKFLMNHTASSKKEDV